MLCDEVCPYFHLWRTKRLLSTDLAKITMLLEAILIRTRKMKCCESFVAATAQHSHRMMANDSATAATRRLDWNSDAMPPLQRMVLGHGFVTAHNTLLP